MRSSSIIVAVFLVYQICFNAGEESGNCTLKPISNNNNTAMISNITVFDYETCIEADNEDSNSSCTLLSESCSFSSCELLLNDSNKDDYCYNLTDSCILLSNGSNCTIVSSSIMILTSTDSISPSLSDTPLTISSSTVVFTSVVDLSSESTIQHTSLQSKSSSIPISPSIPSSSATTLTISSSTEVSTSAVQSTSSQSTSSSILISLSIPSLSAATSTISSSTVVSTSVVLFESTTQHTNSQSTSPSPSVTVHPTFQLSDLIEEPLIYYWPPGLALLMLMCCACIFCLILCIRIRSWKSKMKAYKFVIAHDCGIQDLKYIDLPSRYDSKIEFTTFKNLSKLDNKEDKEDAEETELKAGATGEFGEGIPGVIIMESEPVTDLETQALITGEDNENTDEEKKEEKKDDAKDEPKGTSESKQQETGGLEVSIIIESSIINVEAKTTADAQTSGSDDTNCSSKESTTVDTSGIENNPTPLGIVDVTDGSTKQEVSPKQTMGDEKQSDKEGEGKEGAERKPEEDVKKEESKMEDKQEAEKKDLSEDTLTKSMDVFNMQLGAILDLIKDDDKDTKAQTVL